jgi:hypothetical protein
MLINHHCSRSRPAGANAVLCADIAYSVFTGNRSATITLKHVTFLKISMDLFVTQPLKCSRLKTGVSEWVFVALFMLASLKRLQIYPSAEAAQMKPSERKL